MQYLNSGPCVQLYTCLNCFYLVCSSAPCGQRGALQPRLYYVCVSESGRVSPGAAVDRSTRMLIVESRSHPTPAQGESVRVFRCLCLMPAVDTFVYFLFLFTLRDSAVRSRPPPRCRIMFTITERCRMLHFPVSFIHGLI